MPSLDFCDVDCGAGTVKTYKRATTTCRAQQPQYMRPPDKSKKNQEGDYYVGEKMVVNHKRMRPLRSVPTGSSLIPDRYVSCMAKEGQAP